MFLTWLEAVNNEIQEGLPVLAENGYEPMEGTLSAFVSDRMRDEFKPALEAWLDSRPLTNPDAAPTPFRYG